MSELIDLDKVSVPDLRFKLGGKTYVAPGELDVETMLRWIRIQNGWLALSAQSAAVRKAIDEGSELPDDLGDLDSPADLLVESRDEVLKLLRERDPKVRDLPLKSSQIGTVFAALFGRYQEAEAGGADPTPPTRKPARKRRS